jgi:membrane protein YdbS with pleckstrin-like domain
MLTDEEEKFLVYWRNNREKKTTLISQLSLGLPLGLLVGVGIILNYVSGWYTRATMVANSQSTPIVLIIAVILITIFCSVFYKRHRWDMNEQRYLELTYKKEKQNSSSSMQQDDELDSQIGN